jgi:integrase
MPERWRALVLLAATTSLRWGELMALTRADVDLEHGTVRVVNAVSDVNGKVVVGPPKSAAGRRTVAVPASVVPVLREHVASFSEASAGGRVFVGVRGRFLAPHELPAAVAAGDRGGRAPRGVPVP